MVRFKCKECRRTVTGSAYRATCPTCGGVLLNLEFYETTNP